MSENMNRIDCSEQELNFEQFSKVFSILFAEEAEQYRENPEQLLQHFGRRNHCCCRCVNPCCCQRSCCCNSDF